MKVKFWSCKKNMEIEGDVIKENHYTYILRLPDGNVIKKKKRQVTA